MIDTSPRKLFALLRGLTGEPITVPTAEQAFANAEAAEPDSLTQNRWLEVAAIMEARRA